MVVRCIENIRRVGFDLIVCDEAHRLKNSNVKITSLISGLEIPKCVLLTGTPIQNNLEELFTLADLACPSVLGMLKKRFFIERLLLLFKVNPIYFPGLKSIVGCLLLLLKFKVKNALNSYTIYYAMPEYILEYSKYF